MMERCEWLESGTDHEAIDAVRLVKTVAIIPRSRRRRGIYCASPIAGHEHRTVDPSLALGMTGTLGPCRFHTKGDTPDRLAHDRSRTRRIHASIGVEHLRDAVAGDVLERAVDAKRVLANRPR